MSTNTLSQERIDWILSEVKRIGLTHRKPDGNDASTWRYHAKRRRFGGAYPKDLGASNRDQSITRDMYRMVKLGYLAKVNDLYFPGFVIAEKKAS